ncbi:SecY-interacting protein [Scandinavium lactucae]|uniref:Protein Syd n=1 Tax=Scandinavium lactucae TaxID=3095028 RepID=A0ABU4QSC1_9ENTR|nr:MULTISPECIES: SecY-interacting protein [unclassified Scandinavium]MDX6041710.1 SecY-interacting protein [Scandinavium sp. V105_6]MDX6051377.1 SecY-interacting protein [Scandinavium sp. V105_1]
MDQQTATALQAFTQRYCDAWQQRHGTAPRSEELHGIASPCVTASDDDAVFWLPQPFTLEPTLQAVERAMDIVVQHPLQTYYTSQFAGDMSATFGERELTLLQVWSADDFQRVQENLIGHLVTQKRLKLSPTLFIGTLDSELDVVSVCNLTGEVVLETLGTRNRTTLSASVASFLTHAEPLV